MKQRLLLISLTALQFSFFTCNVQATTLFFPELSDRSACAACIPDMPGLPQEDDFICGDVTGVGLVNVLDIISEDNCGTYGGLYDWDEAMQYVTTQGAQGIRPGRVVYCHRPRVYYFTRIPWRDVCCRR